MTIPHTAGRVKRSSPRNPCPICGGQGCGQIGESLVLCWRVQSDQPTRSGAWKHGALPYDQKRLRQRVDPPISPIERRHAVFSALLDRLPLSSFHADKLMQERGLDDAAIARYQFASVPDYATAGRVTKELAAEFDLTQVPGFYLKDEPGDEFDAYFQPTWRLRFVGERMQGFYIPLRDVQGRIEALQIRRDAVDDEKFRYCLVSTPDDEFPAGAGSRAPYHFAGNVQAEKAVITEGGLKATVCAQMLGCCMFGLVSVSTFQSSIGWQLRRDLPNLRELAIAFDADARANRAVACQLKRLQEALEAAGYQPKLLTWPAELGKGLDDFLLNGGMRAE